MSDRRFNGESGEIINFDYGWKDSWEFKTEISTLIGGGEQRRARWTRPLRAYSIPFANKTATALNTLKMFFYDHKGQYDTFLFYDPNCKMRWTIPAGQKVITNPPGSVVQKLYLPFKPVKPMLTAPLKGTDIKVYASGTEFTSGEYANITVDVTQGSITFNGSQPPSTQLLEVEFEYYVRVRFANDKIERTEKFHKLMDLTIDLIEER